MGDKGVIERISRKPVKVLFPSETIKAELLDTEVNPFRLLFVVDVEVETVGDVVAAYKILSVHENFERPEE